MFESNRFTNFKFKKMGDMIHDAIIYSAKSLRSLDFMDDDALENFYENFGFKQELKMLRIGIRNEIYSNPILKYNTDLEHGKCLTVVVGETERTFKHEDIFRLLNKDGHIVPRYALGTNKKDVDDALGRLYPDYIIKSNYP